MCSVGLCGGREPRISSAVVSARLQRGGGGCAREAKRQAALSCSRGGFLGATTGLRAVLCLAHAQLQVCNELKKRACATTAGVTHTRLRQMWEPDRHGQVILKEQVATRVGISSSLFMFWCSVPSPATAHPSR